MNKVDVPIPFHELTFLQDYLSVVFSSDKQCQNNFNNLEWSLHEKYTDEEITEIKNSFRKNGISCDCDIIYKLDPREAFTETIKPHDTM